MDKKYFDLNPIVTKLVDETDLDTISNIANKYDMNIVELGKLLSKIKVGNGITKQIKFSENEVKRIDKIVNDKKRVDNSRNVFFIEAYTWFMDNQLIKEIDVFELKQKTNDRTFRVNIYFSDADQFESILRTSKSLGCGFSSFIRYFTLKYVEYLNK